MRPGRPISCPEALLRIIGYKCIWLDELQGPRPYKFTGFAWAFMSQTPVANRNLAVKPPSRCVRTKAAQAFGPCRSYTPVSLQRKALPGRVRELLDLRSAAGFKESPIAQVHGVSKMCPINTTNGVSKAPRQAYFWPT